MTFVAMVVEGILRQDHGDGVINAGALLYHSLKEHSRIALLTEDGQATEHWLKVNGFQDHVTVVPPTALGVSKDEVRVRQIRRLQRDGTSLSFILEPDPEIAARLLREGFPTILMLHPRYTRPSFRPDFDPRSVQPWDELAAEVERQRELRAQDQRANEETL